MPQFDLAIVANPIVFLLLFLSAFEFKKFSTDDAGQRGLLRIIAIFILIRYVILPVAGYFALVIFSRDIAFAILILGLLPVGATTPSIIGILCQQAFISNILLVITSVLCPILMLISVLVNFENSTFEELTSLGVSYFLIVVAPLILYLPFRNTKKLTIWITGKKNMIAMIAILLLIFSLVVDNKNFLVNHIDRIPQIFLPAISAYSSFIFVGYLFDIWITHKNHTFLLSSTFNNIALGIGLSALLLPNESQIFFLVAEGIWILLLIIYNYLIKE